MSVGAYMYLDHQEVIDYPIAEVVDSVLLGVDEVVLAAATDAQRDLALATGAKFHRSYVSDKRIRTPGDISESMNLCVAQARAAGHTWCLLVQADTAATPTSLDVCAAWVRNDTRSLHLSVWNAKLSMDFGDGWGHTLVNTAQPPTFYGDGLGAIGPDPNKPRCLSLGYLSLAQFRRHILQHDKTWPNDWLARWYIEADEDPRKFIREQIELMKPYRAAFITDVAPEYQCYLDQFVPPSEQQLVKEVLASL